MTLIVVIASWNNVKMRSSHFLAGFLIMCGLMNGVFAATDSILFYVFWEAMLVPMFLIIGIWGGANRIYATLKFFIYTFFGSVFLLIALIYLGKQANSFDIFAMHQLVLTRISLMLMLVAERPPLPGPLRDKRFSSTTTEILNVLRLKVWKALDTDDALRTLKVGIDNVPRGWFDHLCSEVRKWEVYEGQHGDASG